MTPEERYEQEVKQIVGQLRTAANDVERLGLSATVAVGMTSATRERPALDRAYDVAGRLRGLAYNLDPAALILAAVRVDHPVTIYSPAGALDAAATALAGALAEEARNAEPDCVYVAEAVLRGLGVIR